MESNPIWTRRSNSKLSLSMSGENAPASKIFGPPSATKSRGGDTSSHGSRHFNPFNAASPLAMPSPTSASSAFGLGSGAFATFGSSLKTPKTPGQQLGEGNPLPTPGGSSLTKKPSLSTVEERSVHPLKHTWVVWYRSPGSKFQDYEKSTQKVASFSTAEEFWAVFTHLKRPSTLPHVSDYHFFKSGIKPVWEDKENKNGGKWILRLKKGVSTRYWENLLLAIVGDQFAEAGDDLCGAVLSIRNNEDVMSVWTRVDGPSCLKIKQTIMRTLALPLETVMVFKSHAASIEAINNKTT